MTLSGEDGPARSTFPAATHCTAIASLRSRWQDRAGKHVTWAVAVEDPKSDIGNPSALDGLNRSTMPNFAGHVRWTSTAGSHLQVGADLFRLTWQGGQSGPSDSATGFGLNVTGRLLVAQARQDALMGGRHGGPWHRGRLERDIVCVLLALMVWRQFPLSGIWPVGTMVGVNLLFNGLSTMTVGTAARRLTGAAAVT